MPLEFTIRLAAPADAEAIHRLVHRAYRGDAARAGWTHEADLVDGVRAPLSDIRAATEDPGLRMLIAVSEAGGALLGCVQVTDKRQGGAYLGMLAVDPALQAGGLGRALIAAAETEAQRAFGARRMEMTVIKQRPELIAYYLRRGYRDSGREAPFPYGNDSVGTPRREDLVFVVLEKELV